MVCGDAWCHCRRKVFWAGLKTSFKTRLFIFRIQFYAGLNNHFKISVLPKLKKIDINNASLKELSQFYYFKYAIAKEIVTYRSMNGDFKNIEDLTKIKGFPVDKAKIIALYLDFN